MLRIGPAGWDYRDWDGIVYPRGLKGTDRLAWLAAWFGTVEINVTFYRPVDSRLTALWLTAVADNPSFRFTAKLWQMFTHERRLSPPEAGEFQAGLLPLLKGGRLGALLAQFPYSFHNTEENRAYLVELHRVFADFPLALEVRHRSWQRREVRDFLHQTGWDFCNIDQPQVSYSLGYTAWVTGSRGYLRCHGRHHQAWFEFGQDRQARYDYLYCATELQELAAWTRELSAQAQEVYLIFNNHPRGQAVANALETAHLLLAQNFRLPPGLLKAFPRLDSMAL
jgi:uncharacterized protein YecE (DUF72 family)